MRPETTSLQTASRLCFRRWTRSRAAVFRSLGQCVTIGHLALNVLERLAGKSSSLTVRISKLGLLRTEEQEEQEELQEEALESARLLGLVTLGQSPSLSLSTGEAGSDLGSTKHPTT